jgi:5'-nucleotidase
MKRYWLSLPILALAGAGFAAPAQAEFSLTILHINDLHSRIEPITGTDSLCSAEDDAAGECFGGIARVKSAIDARRSALGADGKNVITLDAGDQYQGSLFYTTYKGDETVEFMNAIGFDAMAVGNHEFDDGPEGLAKLVDGLEFPIISGNIDVANEPTLAGKLKGAVVLTVGGERIGIVSTLAEDTVETSSPGDGVVFFDAEDYLKSVVAALEEAGINKIIALTHMGYARDQQIAAEVPGIDVIVGGHSHTLLSNTDENALGPYPTMVTNPDGKDVPIVQAYAYSKYLGELNVTFDDEGNVTAAEGAPILLDASIVPDADLVARVAEMAAPLEEIKARVIGEAADLINGDRNVCRVQECSMGNLVADAQLDRVADQGVTISIANSGGLRASIDAGEITMGEVLTVLPFSNTLATFKISGADLVASLENGTSQIADVAGRFPQVAGLKYTFDASKDAGSRVSDVLVMEGDAWVPIDPAATYGVVTNNYVRGGGDGYELFATNAVDAYDFGPPLEEVVAEYIAKLGGSYSPYTDGRITDATPAAPAEPEPAADAMAPAADAMAPAADATAPAADAMAPAADAMAPAADAVAPAAPAQ